MKAVHKFKPNMIGRDFVVGDLHGMYDKFMAGLEQINFDFNADRMFCVGDLIDRGPDSAECVRLINAPWLHAVRGNHEVMMINQDWIPWMRNGGEWARSEDNIKALIALAATLPVAIQVEGRDGEQYGVVHAQVPGEDWNLVNWSDPYVMESALWGRTKIKNVLKGRGYATKNIDLVFHGHTPTKRVIRDNNHVWLDTGACLNDGHLTILNMRDEYDAKVRDGFKEGPVQA